jgi:hypothetical protein
MELGQALELAGRFHESETDQPCPSLARVSPQTCVPDELNMSDATTDPLGPRA